MCSLREQDALVSDPAKMMKGTMTHRYGVFVCANGSYLPYVNALLNSVDKHALDLDVHLLHSDMPSQYMEEVTRSFRFPVHLTEIRRADFAGRLRNHVDTNLFLKQSRFKYVRALGERYDAICMLDADMFVASHAFMNLFDLVRGTSKLIGCNEKDKWTFNKRYTHQGQPLFDVPTRALKFHCSVPIIFDMKQWCEVFDYYNQLAYNAFEVDEVGRIIKPIADMFCWNISILKKQRQNDVVLFPMSVMTQARCTYAHPWTRLEKRDGMWMTYEGDEVFTVHGKFGDRDWHNEQLRGLRVLATEYHISGNYMESVEATIQGLFEEWFELNYCHQLKLDKYIPKEKFRDYCSPKLLA